jgi:hypothetical protein
MNTSRLLPRWPRGGGDQSIISSTPTPNYIGSLLQLIFYCVARLVVMTIYDPFTCKFPRCNSRCRASVAYSFPFSGIMAVLRSFFVWIFCCMALIGSIRVEKSWKLIMSCDWMASSHSFSIVCVTCPYWLESPSGLAACTISRLSQQTEVMCSSLLMKIDTFWCLRFGLIGSIWWDFIDVIYEIPCSVQGAALKPVGASSPSTLMWWDRHCCLL